MTTVRQRDVLAGLTVNLRVLHALLLREVITRFGRHNIGVLWLVGEPMLFTIAVALLWYGMGFQHGSSLPIGAFAVTGYSSILMWRNTVGRCNSAVLQNTGLLFHRSVKVLDILLCRIVLECSAAICSFFILSLALVATGWVSPPEDWLKMVFGLLLLAWFSACLGLAIGAAASLSEITDRIWHPVSYIMLPLSGAVYMVSWLPPSTQEFVLFFPMVHCLELIREGFFGTAITAHYDLAYVMKFCLSLNLLGLLLVRVASRRAEGL
jgi:capsular polysaccharide transport system permease protein